MDCLMKSLLVGLEFRQAHDLANESSDLPVYRGIVGDKVHGVPLRVGLQVFCQPVDRVLVYFKRSHQVEKAYDSVGGSGFAKGFQRVVADKRSQPARVAGSSSHQCSSKIIS